MATDYGDWEMKFRKIQTELQTYIQNSSVFVKEGETKEERAQSFIADYDKAPESILGWLRHLMTWLFNPVGKLRNIATAAEVMEPISELIDVARSYDSSKLKSPMPVPKLSAKTITTLNVLREKKKKLGRWSTVRASLSFLEGEIEAFQQALGKQVNATSSSAVAEAVSASQGGIASSSAVVVCSSSRPKARRVAPESISLPRQEEPSLPSVVSSSPRLQSSSRVDLEAVAIVQDWLKEAQPLLASLKEVISTSISYEALLVGSETDRINFLKLTQYTEKLFKERINQKTQLSDELIRTIQEKLQHILKKLKRKYHPDFFKKIDSTEIFQNLNGESLIEDSNIIRELVELWAGRKKQKDLSQESKDYLESHGILVNDLDLDARLEAYHQDLKALFERLHRELNEIHEDFKNKMRELTKRLEEREKRTYAQLAEMRVEAQKEREGLNSKLDKVRMEAQKEKVEAQKELEEMNTKLEEVKVEAQKEREGLNTKLEEVMREQRRLREQSEGLSTTVVMREQRRLREQNEGLSTTVALLRELLEVSIREQEKAGGVSSQDRRSRSGAERDDIETEDDPLRERNAVQREEARGASDFQSMLRAALFSNSRSSGSAASSSSSSSASSSSVPSPFANNYRGKKTS